MDPAATQRWSPFERAFIEAVLVLRGADEAPSLADFRAAVATLSEFFSALARSPCSNEIEDLEGWAGDPDAVANVAAQYAFLFTQYGLAYWSHAGVEQTSAFTHWRETGSLPPLRRHG